MVLSETHTSVGISCLVVFLAALSCTATTIPQIKTPAPGFFRLMLGDFEITALHDGTVPFNMDEIMPTVPKEEMIHALHHEDIPLPVTGTINAFLVNTNDHLVLIDTGVGILFGNCCGLLQANLLAAGYRPEQIDYVFLTHLHSDHEAGLAPHGTMAFPNAVVRTSQPEVDYWLDAANRVNATDYWKQFQVKQQAH
ncbi:hypothetical protein BV898_01937 [Hypsibius exemplaris]|uniref:Metallo-beta-lactamase domain-containing protein n=1 Tax=Hypsibius exemplaris TaxID=2072580 RepID=A0A1W0XA83_HYPEX|nr:hypothetical protein BV898_01937 [Hypsibius exemplaris]